MNAVPEKYKDIGDFLIGKGFCYCGNHPLKPVEAHLFQITIREEEENGKRFVDVWLWDLDDMWDQLAGEPKGLGFDIESIFETENYGWVNLSFYSQKEEDLRANLDTTMTKIGETFKLLGGAYQD